MGADQAGPRASSGLHLGELLTAVESSPPVAAVEVVASMLADSVAARDVGFLIADYSGDSLIRLGHSDRPRNDGQSRETAERVPLIGTAQGRALSGQSVQVVPEGARSWLYAPVTSRGEAVGVLELAVDDPPDERVVSHVAQAAHALAYIVIANRRYTDLFEWGQRSVPLSLAAEIQHRLLPGSYTCEAGQFTIAAWLEPAGEVGGDTFDFSVDRDTLTFSITDAMGHTVNASLLATLLVGSLRHGRRRGATLVEQAELADTALADHARRSAFVTGQLVRIDLSSGVAEIVNAGHPPPLRLRGGLVDEVKLHADAPFGAVAGTKYTLQRLPLEPGDRLLFLTDGVLERKASAVDVRAMLSSSRDAHPREAIQRLIRAAVDASGGRLEDDATALCFDWHGGSSGRRVTDAGADVR
jgi:serine phosphatase RsbU (regulator of sigma subunit)